MRSLACCKRIETSDRLASRRRCCSFAIAPASPTSDLDTDGSSKPLGDAHHQMPGWGAVAAAGVSD
ncbi:hypothetical protein XAPC_1668 [Xanthomonas citri pv. punicae str. LMG 859]|nr:hypothetical protein XAPC_1668 [Xanthomonas citri pv. punicae str. LMG 859]